MPTEGDNQKCRNKSTRKWSAKFKKTRQRSINNSAIVGWKPCIQFCASLWVFRTQAAQMHCFWNASTKSLRLCRGERIPLFTTEAYSPYRTAAVNSTRQAKDAWADTCRLKAGEHYACRSNTSAFPDQGKKCLMSNNVVGKYMFVKPLV